MSTHQRTFIFFMAVCTRGTKCVLQTCHIYRDLKYQSQFTIYCHSDSIHRLCTTMRSNIFSRDNKSSFRSLLPSEPALLSEFEENSQSIKSPPPNSLPSTLSFHSLSSSNCTSIASQRIQRSNRNPIQHRQNKFYSTHTTQSQVS